MSKSVTFCDECGILIAKGQEEISIGGGTFKIVCKRCYRAESASPKAITGANAVDRVSQAGANAENG